MRAVGVVTLVVSELEKRPRSMYVYLAREIGYYYKYISYKKVGSGE